MVLRVTLTFSDFALEFYTFLADNYTPFHSMLIECTDRDAAFVLDGLLYNESDLEIEISLAIFVECATIRNTCSNTPLNHMANKRSQQLPFNRLDDDSLAQIGRQIQDPATFLNFSSANRVQYNQHYEARQRALSEMIIQRAELLAQGNAIHPLLERFNDCMLRAQSIEIESYREETIKALHKLVPEDVLSRLNQYDQEIDDARAAGRDVRPIRRAGLEDFWDRFWRLELPVTQQILFSVEQRSGVQGPVPRTAANRAGSQPQVERTGDHSYPPPEQPAARQVAQLRAQTQESHGRGCRCRIM